MASKRPHPNGWLIRWREPSEADPRVAVQRSWVCGESEARAEVHREEAERAEDGSLPWVPPDRRPRPGRPGVEAEVNALLAQHGLRGAAAHYTKDLRGIERRPGTIVEVRHSLRSFLRWLTGHLGQQPGSRIAPNMLSVSLLHNWWDWMTAKDRVCVVHVRRKNREYDRIYKGPLKRSSAYKEWTSIVAFWRWAAAVDEFGGAIPRCPVDRLKRPYRDPSRDAGARRRVVAASWPQAGACVAAVADWVQPLAILCYYTGLRVKQARALTWDDVHFNDRFAKEHGGPVLWVGYGKTEAQSDGRFMPLHPALVAWLRERRLSRPSLDELSRDLRRTDSAAYKARAAGLAEGRIAWEVGDQNVSLQLSRAWKEADVDPTVWERRTCHAFRKALRTNIMDATTEPGAKAWQAAERLIGHALPGQLDIYQSDRVLMPHMRKLVESIPSWEAAAEEHGRKVIPMAPVYDEEDMQAL